MTARSATAWPTAWPSKKRVASTFDRAHPRAALCAARAGAALQPRGRHRRVVQRRRIRTCAGSSLDIARAPASAQCVGHRAPPACEERSLPVRSTSGHCLRPPIWPRSESSSESSSSWREARARWSIVSPGPPCSALRMPTRSVCWGWSPVPRDRLSMPRVAHPVGREPSDGSLRCELRAATYWPGSTFASKR